MTCLLCCNFCGVRSQSSVELLEGEELFVSTGLCLQQEEHYFFLQDFPRQPMKLVPRFLHLLMGPVLPGTCRPLADTQSNPPAILTSDISALFGFPRLNWAHGELLMRQLPCGRRLEVGHHCYLLRSRCLSGVKDGNEHGRVALGEPGHKCCMELDQLCPTPRGENIPREKAPPSLFQSQLKAFQVIQKKWVGKFGEGWLSPPCRHPPQPVGRGRTVATTLCWDTVSPVLKADTAPYGYPATAKL